jgi:hypothetical protein
VEVISGKLAQFDDRLAEVNAEYTILFDQVDTIHHVDIPDLQTQLGSLQERVDESDFFSTADQREYTPQPALHEREDVKDNIQALQTLVDGMSIWFGVKDLLICLFIEMRVLRETSKVQMTADLESIRVMRETAVANINEAQAQAAKAIDACTFTVKNFIEQRITPLDDSQTPVLLSLKRKRDDTDENEEVDESENTPQSVGVEGSIDPVNQDKDVVMDEEVSVPSTKPEVLAATTVVHQLDAPHPRKRARRIVSVLAQTTTAVTIGAVAAWSALAFS